jgi:hypothetical protein
MRIGMKIAKLTPVMITSIFYLVFERPFMSNSLKKRKPLPVQSSLTRKRTKPKLLPVALLISPKFTTTAPVGLV